jgi:hypothetical protein
MTWNANSLNCSTFQYVTACRLLAWFSTLMRRPATNQTARTHRRARVVDGNTRSTMKTQRCNIEDYMMLVIREHAWTAQRPAAPADAAPFLPHTYPAGLRR